MSVTNNVQLSAAPESTRICDAIARVRERIAAACHRSGRSPAEVRLIAISKTMPADRIREAFHAGIAEFGENRVQEAENKQLALADLPITWHLVGQLQKNKAARASRMFHCIHSVDSASLGAKIDAGIEGDTTRLPVLVQLNLSHEATKGGIDEEDVQPVIEELSRLKQIHVKGLMQVPPFFADAELTRPYFRRMRAMSEKIRAAKIAGVDMDDLSMGMSHDFEVAIEEGATLIRVGQAIFGSRS